MRNPIMWIAMNIFVRDSWEWVRDLPRFEAQKLSTSLKPNSFPPQIQKKKTHQATTNPNPFVLCQM